MTPDETPPHPAIVATGRAVDRAVRRLDALEAVVRTLVENVAVVHPSNTGAPAADEFDELGVRSWLLADDVEQATQDAGDLVDWLTRVYLRFDRAVLSTCWLWHPDVVEELWWLRCAHGEAYDATTGSWLRVGDWHDRQRPGVVARVNAVLGTCALSRHAARNGRGPDVVAPAAVPMAAHRTAVVAAWVGDGVPGPVPTEEMLAQASAYEDVAYRRSR